MKRLHGWNLTPRQAVALQRTLQAHIRTDLPLDSVRRVAGTDVAYLKDRKESVATVAILAYPGLEVLEWKTVRMPTPFPYVPGLLSFRETPPLLKALDRLSCDPDLILVDGHGRAHPRRLGIACHLGLWLEKPTIGIGKTLLCGRYWEPGVQRGERTPLEDQGEIVGTVLRTRTGVRPIFVSVGYGIPLEECIRWVLRLTPRFRIPEPIRQADRLARQARNDPSAV